MEIIECSLECPRLINQVNLIQLFHQLKQESVHFNTHSFPKKYSVIFETTTDETSNIVRAIQEEEILKTKVQVRGKTLRSYWDIWYSNPFFRQAILSSSNPNEEKWKLCNQYNYRLATTFMPIYAKAIYQYFQQPTIVLDPCSGWGDRLLGAITANIPTYIGFDPNYKLKTGYSSILNLDNITPINSTDYSVEYSNSYVLYSLPFESNQLLDNSVDFIFTSPPFFNYEIYSDENPIYDDWIEEFYIPLFIQCARVIKPNCYVCIYLNDTSAGEIQSFLMNVVPTICSLQLQSKSIGFKGIWSNSIRKIWVYQKIERNNTNLVNKIG